LWNHKNEPKEEVFVLKKGTVKEFNKTEGYYLVETKTFNCARYNYRGMEEKTFTHRMTVEEVDKNPYRLWSKYFGDTFNLNNPWAYTELKHDFVANINWDEFLIDLNEVPEIANLFVNVLMAPPFMYVMLAPKVPFIVIQRLLEINPTAVDYDSGSIEDGGSWMNVVFKFYDGWRTGEFINEINPKTLRLIMETMNNDEIPIEDNSGCNVLIECFVGFDTEHLTLQTKIILELSPCANLHVLKRHFSGPKYANDECKLGDLAFKFCSDLITNNVGNNYSPKAKLWLQQMIGGTLQVVTSEEWMKRDLIRDLKTSYIQLCAYRREHGKVLYQRQFINR